MNYGFGQALLDSVVGILVVFFALVLLMCIIKIMTAIGDSRAKKNAPAAAPAKAAEPAPLPCSWPLLPMSSRPPSMS